MPQTATSPTDIVAIQGEWLRRVEAEYRSAAITQHLTLWLMQLVAPFELVRMGLGIVEDELVHSELSHDVYAAAGGNAVPALGAARLGLNHPARDQLLAATVRCAVETFCLGETVAVRLFTRLRSACEQPQARRALDRILKDEVKHKDFGWTMLEWLLSTPEEAAVRHVVTTELPQMLERVRRNYAYAELGKTQAPSEARAFWGLMPAPNYADALEETLNRDYVPLFAALGIDAAKAWHTLETR
jgi:hypothetical protein